MPSRPSPYTDSVPVNPVIANLEYAIRDVVLPAKQLEAQGRKILYLNIGDPLAYDYRTPDYFLNAAIRALQSQHNSYADSQGVRELREALVQKEKTVNGISLDPEQIVVTTGISEGIRLVLAALLTRGDEVLIPGPGYPPYIELTKLSGGVPVAYRMDEENQWNPDLDDLRARITPKTRAIVIINPNNPTGAVYSESSIKRIGDIAAEHSIPLISDEIYDQLIFEGQHTPTAKICKDVPVIGLNGLSKCYLVTGWRIGYIYYHDPANRLVALQDSIMKQARIRLCAVTPLQYAAAQALKSPASHLPGLVKSLRERRDIFVKRVNAIEGLSCVTPRGAIYAFPRIESKKWTTDKAFVLDLLQSKGVLVVHGSGFDPVYGAGHFRTVLLPPVAVIHQACDLIEEFMQER